MPRMKILAVAGALGLLAGCLMREGNYRNYGARPHEWDLKGPDYVRKVFGPVPSEEVKEFVREKEAQGWEVVGYEPASLPEDAMVNSSELDQPSPAKKPRWSPDLPKTMDARTDPPKKETIPPYLDEDVRNHRQKYLVIMRRWL
jgi:hypothetical protein